MTTTVGTGSELTALERPVEREVVRLALPAVGEQVLNASVAIVDTYLVGHLGATELAAVGLANQLVLTATAIFTAAAVGSTALIARAIGAHDPLLAQRALGQSALLALLLGGLAGLSGGLLAAVLLAALNAEPDVLELGSAFLRIVSLTMPLTAFLFIGNASLRGAGDTVTPLRVMLLVNAVNIVVAAALVYGAGPLPVLGVTGVAIGATVARGLGGLVVLLVLLRGHRGLRLMIGNVLPQPTILRRILRVAIPATVEIMLLRLAQMSFAAIIASLGTVAYAAHVVVLNAEAISYMPGTAFAMAATTVVGQRLGAKQPSQARHGAYYAFKLGAGLMSLMGVVLFVFPVPFIAVFTNDPEVQAAAVPVMRVAALLQPGIAASMIFGGALRGAGDTRWPLYINGVGMWLVRVIGGNLIVHLGGGLTQVWLLLIVDFIVRGGAIFLRFRNGAWLHTKV